MMVYSKEIKPTDSGSLTDSHSILRQEHTTGDKYTENALCDFSPYVWLINGAIILAAVRSILSVSFKRSHYSVCDTQLFRNSN